MKGDRGMSAQRNILNTLLLEQKQRIHGGIYHRLQIDLHTIPTTSRAAD